MAYPNPTFQTAQILTTPSITDSSTNAANTAFVAESVAAMPGRNYFVDGNFDSIINASVAVAAGVSSNGVATMYYGIAGATNGGTLSATWTLGYDPIGMNSPVGNALTWTQSSAPTSSPSIAQRIENVQTLQGRSATFSCWLWCGSGTQTITNVQILQNFGSGGSPSSPVTVNVPVNWVLTTTPQRFSALLNVPSVVGKTLGTTSNAHYLQVYVQYPASGTYAISTTQWQLEHSNPNAPATGAPTAFDYRGIGAELARVQRYYETGSLNANGYSGATNQYCSSPYAFKATKRIIPTITVTNLNATLVNATPASTVVQVDGLAPQHLSTAVGGYGYTDNWIADARL